MKRPILYVVGFILFLFWFFWGCAVILSGCAVTKGKEEKKENIVYVDSTKSGKVTENKETVNTDWEWFRNTLIRDTIINKNYYTSNLPAPQVIIMEGGKGQQNVVKENRDSIWELRLEKLLATLSEKKETKETEVLNFWQIVGLVIGGVIVAVILSKLRFKL